LDARNKRADNLGFVSVANTFAPFQTNSPAANGISRYMRKNIYWTTLLLGTALVCSPAMGWSQQPYPGQEDHTAKQDAKRAGHEAKDSVKDTGRAVKHGTKKAYRSTKYHGKRAAHRTKNATRGAVDGAKEGARNPQ
jgi:hypothetical protein